MKKIKHFLQVLNHLKKNRDEKAYLSLIKGKDYAEVMEEVRIAEWCNNHSYNFL
ncbi:MAG: hypothetical protein Q8P20_08005 [bacterium]|nr:hypothetical protein [bacterium]MDZ4227884.1 hypothetical protein [Candidatus Levybacteria bacterium]